MNFLNDTLFKKWISFALTSLSATSLTAAETPPNSFGPSGSDDIFFKEFMNMLTSLGLILVVLMAIAWLFKRLSAKRLEQVNEASVMKIIESRPLSQKTMLYLVEIEGTAIAFTESTNGVTHLAQFELEKP